ncbi:MAG: hypothetical protein M0C28_19350 [Candidatus Moduliflexus flocculans]|nr:hypothetical protein [Candidatus Moduliflexus flocculans]
MEAARLTDELAAVADHIPSGRRRPCVLQKPFEGDDADAHPASRAIADGCADLAAVQRALRMSAVRLAARGRETDRGRMRHGGRRTSRRRGRPGRRGGGEGRPRSWSRSRMIGCCPDVCR